MFNSKNSNMLSFSSNAQDTLVENPRFKEISFQNYKHSFCSIKTFKGTVRNYADIVPLNVHLNPIKARGSE